nr:hypothetical protein MACL_00003014 [Theileria orientalis]
MIDTIFFKKEEELKNLKDVFRRLVALDIYFDIKSSQNRKNEAKIEKKGTKNSNLSAGEATVSGNGVSLSECFENSSATDNAEGEGAEEDNSIFSNDQAFSELNSNRTNLESFSGQTEGEEDLEGGECFVEHIFNDLANLIRVKKLYYCFFKDPLVQYIVKQYKTHREDLYALYKKYLNYVNERIQLDQGEICESLKRNLLCNLNQDFGQVNIVKVLKNEVNELGKELNGLIINYYDSRINLSEIYYLMEYYNLDMESLSIDINTVQYGLRMDGPVKEYFSNEDFVNKLLHQLTENGGNEPKTNYKQFYNLVVYTANIFNRNKLDNSNNISSGNNTYVKDNNEEDVLKIVKRYKLDINDHKNPYSAYVKLFLDNLNELLDDLIKKKEVESYDIFGGHRYGYLLINDINVDVLVKIYNVENVKNVFNYIKRNLSKLNTVNTKEKSKEQLNIWVLNNKNVSSNLLAKELVIEAKRGKKEFNFKLYFTIVKYDRKRSVRKVNINEYLMEKLDEVHRKYVNISNAVVLAKLFLQSYNLDKIALKEVASSLNGSGYGKVEACRTFGTSELNGHVFNLLLTHLCTINSYSENVKSIILFKNVLTFIVNTVGKDGGVLVYCEQNNSSNVGTTSGDNVADSKEEVSDRSYDRAETVFNDEINHKLAESGLYEEYVKSVSGEFRKRVSLYTQKYAEVDLLKHIELTFPQLVYYCKIGLGILSDDTSKADKIARLFLQRNYLSNFYEHNMFIRTDSSDGTDSSTHNPSGDMCNIAELKQLLHLLRYVFKERLYLAHLYYIKRYSTDDTGSTSTSDNINTSTNNNNNNNINTSTSDNINTNTSTNNNNNNNTTTNNITNNNITNNINSNCNDGVMIYFTFNHNIQEMLDYGPKYTTNTSSGGRGNTAVSNFENKMYEYIWGDNYQLVKSNNIIQYTVNLSKITVPRDIGISTAIATTTTNNDTDTTNINITTVANTTANANNSFTDSGVTRASAGRSTAATKNAKNSGKTRSADEQVLLLSDLDENLNYRLLKYVLYTLINKRLLRRIGVSINNFNVRYPFISEYQKDLISTTNDFTDILTSLECLPLKILNTQIINETYSYLNLYSPKVGENEGASDHGGVVKVVVKWEYSNKWPNEEVAYNNVVTSLLLLISKELKHRYRMDSKFREGCLYVEYGDHTYQLIHYKHNKGSGIGIGNTISMIGSGCGSNSTSNTATNGGGNSSFGSMISVIGALGGKNGIGVGKSSSSRIGSGGSAGSTGSRNGGSMGVDDTVAKLEYEYVLNERCRSEVMKNISFVNCVKLMKIFTTKYVKVDINHTIKLLSLKAYEGKSIKSESSIVQFLQILYSITQSSSSSSINSTSSSNNANTTNSTNTNSTANTTNINTTIANSINTTIANSIANTTNSTSTTNTNNTSANTNTTAKNANTNTTAKNANTNTTAKNANTNTTAKNASDDNFGNILKGLSNDVVKKLREYSGKLLKEINGNLKSIPACAGVTVVDEERMNTILSDDWSYDMVVKLHNPEVNKSISTRCNYEGRKYMEYLLKYYKEYLGELADMYYYKYKVYGHFNTRTYRHLNVYFKFNKFSFVPRLSYKAHKYPQSIIMPITHCRRIRKVGDANSLIDTREYDWEDDGADNVIVVPNVILVLRVLTKLADQMLHNVVLTYNTR